ncbi:MAG: hypothetical protein HZC22_19655, partial [Rhodocyclales bacterium]|nr:hypothetical protein [Rhodocyclales bacterium]
MTAERMYDLSFEFLDDGTLRLEQSSGCGETVLVDLHPAQLRLLCERANLTKPTALLLDRLEAGHVRRLRTHLERIQRLVDDDTFFNDLFDRMPDGVEW